MNRDRLRFYRCGEYDHFAQECPNTPMDDEMGHSDSEPTLLQMLTQEDMPINFDGEVEYLYRYIYIEGKAGTTSFLPNEARQVEK